MSRTRTITLTVGSLAAGAVLATGITGLAMAADSTPSPTGTSSAAAAVPGTPGGPHAGRQHLPGMRGGPGGQALHGELVVKAADGTISTVRTINGTVTAVSSSSITVKADDGYSSTFSVTATTEVRVGAPDVTQGRPDPSAVSTDAITDVTVGDVAHVDGTVTGSTATATEVHAMTPVEAAAMEQQRQQRNAG
ncbi:MAG: hypothetical protein NTX29_08315 [Actinobacteria bacterium]|nr:hypothetical protein [Actinomycetota bacterium]